jgi:hypothetical protein
MGRLAKLWRYLLNCSVLALACSVVLASFSMKAAANDQTVQDLYRKCKEPFGSFENALCIGYVTAIGDAMIVWATKTGESALAKSFSMCGSASYGAMIQAFINWAEQHPEEWGQPRVAGVVLALREKWACK